jgi:hypothetical protein
MIYLMTSQTANSIESILRLQFHIFMAQFNVLKEQMKAKYDDANRTSVSIG